MPIDTGWTRLPSGIALLLSLIILIYLCNRNKIPVQKQQIHDIMLFCTGSDPFPVRLRCAGCVYFIVPSR